MNRSLRRPFTHTTVLIAVATAAILLSATVSAVYVSAFDRRAGAASNRIDIASTTSPGLTVAGVTSTAFTTTINLSLRLSEPLPAETTATMAQADLSVLLPGQGNIAGTWLRSVRYGTTTGRDVVEFSLEGSRIPPSTNRVDISLGAIYLVPKSGSGVRHAGPWTASIDLSQNSVPTAVDLTNQLPTQVIDTGFGWQYVVDSLRADTTTVEMSYHVEGDVQGLSPAPPSKVDSGVVFASFPAHGAEATATTMRVPGTSSVRIEFGGAERATSSPSSASIERSGTSWLPTQIAVAGKEWSVKAADTDDHGDPFISIAVASTLLLNEPAAQLQQATLVDNLGQSYSLYHGSGGFPAAESTWDFSGPLNPEASTLTFTVQGYANVEDGNWSMDATMK